MIEILLNASLLLFHELETGSYYQPPWLHSIIRRKKNLESYDTFMASGEP